MSERQFRTLVVASHPVQYTSPLFRRFAQHPQLDFQVAYCSLRGAQPALDPDFGATVQWDVPLLDGYRWIEVPNRGSGSESFFGLRNPGLRNLIRQGRFDAVLCFVGYVRASFWIALRAARSAESAFLFGTDTTTLAPRDQRSWKRSVKALVWPRLFGLADQVLAPSSGTRDLFLALGIPGDRISLTPYSVDNDWWIDRAAQADRSATRATWQIPETDPVVLFCAKLQPWKRPLDLLRAFAKADVANSYLVFAGDGPLRSDLESTASSLGVASRIRFLGFANQSQLPAIYKSADLMVLPSDYEPFGVVANEAMLCGCPVLASDHVGAARDLVAPVASDFIFPAGSVEVLASLLQQALADRGRLASLGLAFSHRMRSWTPDHTVRATVDAIHRAVDRRKALAAS